ncbi:anthranilate synthase component II [Anaeromicropila populeti]|nr:aminodeoxychorismate/anthranilate synthase component II [Anaeromicropila populeti]
MIDNYDSFVYNLIAYLRELGCCVQVIRNDEVDIEKLKRNIEKKEIEGIVISPGPKSPENSGLSKEVLKEFAGKVPILGVCLGHQLIGYHFGAEIKKGKQPVHGKISPITHKGGGLFENIPPSFQVTRYHSLIISVNDFPECLQVDAQTADGVVMAVSHKDMPVYGVQFHPEAVLTQYGHVLLNNYIRICQEWKENEYSSKKA